MKRRLKIMDGLQGCHDILNNKENAIKWEPAPLLVLYKILSTDRLIEDNYSEHYYNLLFNFSLKNNDRLKCCVA